VAAAPQDADLPIRVLPHSVAPVCSMLLDDTAADLPVVAVQQSDAAEGLSVPAVHHSDTSAEQLLAAVGQKTITPAQGGHQVRAAAQQENIAAAAHNTAANKLSATADTQKTAAGSKDTLSSTNAKRFKETLV
jgi:aminoglycoside/choline kinase family phosphotransferase